MTVRIMSDMVSSIQRFKDTALARLGGIVPQFTKVMGITLIFYALLSLYSNCRMEGSLSWMTITGTVVMILMGTAILIDLSFNINHAIGLYALALGLNRFFKFLRYLDNPSGVMFVFALVMIVLSLNLCFTGFVFLRGSVRGRQMMIMNTLLMLMLNLSIMLWTVNYGQFTAEEVFLNCSDTILLMVMYIILICMLSSEQIRRGSVEERYNRVLNRIKLTYTYSNSTSISKKDADVLLKAFDDRSGWIQFDDAGPVENEYRFRIRYDIHEYAFVIVQKWKDSDCLYFNLTDHSGGSLLNAYRFKVDNIADEQDDSKRYVALFCRDGLYMRILVREQEGKR